MKHAQLVKVFYLFLIHFKNKLITIFRKKKLIVVRAHHRYAVMANVKKVKAFLIVQTIVVMNCPVVTDSMTKAVNQAVNFMQMMALKSVDGKLPSQVPKIINHHFKIITLLLVMLISDTQALLELKLMFVL